jgi:hypothetical protein
LFLFEGETRLSIATATDSTSTAKPTAGLGRP